MVQTMTMRKAVEAALMILVDAYGGLFPRNEAMRKAYLYENAVKDYAVECYEPAALECTRSMKFAPTPYEFAEVVRRIHRDKYPDAPQTFARPGNPDAMGEAVRLQQIQKRIDKRMTYVMKWTSDVVETKDADGKVIASRPATMTDKRMEAARIWALVMSRCQSPDETLAVRDGTVSKERIDEAIEAHLRGEVARDERRRIRRQPAVEHVVDTVNEVFKRAVNQ